MAYLQERYGNAHAGAGEKDTREEKSTGGNAGWEILIVSDGSTDKTVDTALAFAKEHQLSQHPVPVPGPRTPKPTTSTHIPHGSIRVMELEQNRGKGGAVTHGMRHVRGQYVVFADADGASRFSDLEKLVEGCRSVEDKKGRGVAIGSRAHLVGSEAVVKVCVPHPPIHQYNPTPFSLHLITKANIYPSVPNSATSSCTRFTCSSTSSPRAPPPA